ncbi:hypothetical protein [Szabonella alba]|uniref:Uncharacterized protein n=1 Tax=Szabonella alba TaxID=2804194 RepID=A0A8K0VA93_9RHOB|nr:hypothetical protein [Szabonella alba]MBL4917271.1 hypothetical protein [Szabonella alba]
MIRTGAAALSLLWPLPLAAKPLSETLYPAVDCAALHLGRDDAARRLRHLPRDTEDPARAEAFRQAAIRLNGGAVAGVDEAIAAARPAMRLLLESLVLDQDLQSRDLYERLLGTCARFAQGAPEFDALR